MRGILVFIEPNPHGESLDNFHVVPGRIFRREQAEKRTGCARQALHSTLIVASESVDADGDRLARASVTCCGAMRAASICASRWTTRPRVSAILCSLETIAARSASTAWAADVASVSRAS